MLDRAYVSPSRYVQGSGALSHLADYTSAYGDTVLIIESAGGKERFHRLRLPAPDDIHQRRPAIVVLRIDVCPGVQEQREGLGVKYT